MYRRYNRSGNIGGSLLKLDHLKFAAGIIVTLSILFLIGGFALQNNSPEVFDSFVLSVKWLLNQVPFWVWFITGGMGILFAVLA